MTDEQIVKAMICCTNFPVCDRDNCPYGESTNCATMLGKDVVELINRLQADKEALIAGQETLQKALAEKDKEIERLNDALINKCIYLSNDETTEYCVNGPCPEFKTESQIKAEAIKEFAERIDTHFEGSGIHWLYEASLKQRIDNLVKEMVGDAE